MVQLLTTTNDNPNAAFMGEDVMADKPEKNTVIMALSKEERDDMLNISQQMDAIGDSNDVPYAKALEVRQAWHNAWTYLFKKHSDVNPSWPMRIDFYTGLVFISE